MIIKQAGPSQSFRWLGHGRSIPFNAVGNPFPDSLPTKWIMSPENVFDTGLILPGTSVSVGGGSVGPSYSAPSAPSSYAPPPPAPTYAPQPEPSYSRPTSGGSFHSQTGHGHSFGHAFGAGTATLPHYTSSGPPVPEPPPGPPVAPHGAVETPVYVPQSSEHNFSYDPIPVKVYDPKSQSFVTQASPLEGHRRPVRQRPAAVDAPKKRNPAKRRKTLKAIKKVPVKATSTKFGGDPRTPGSGFHKSRARPAFKESSTKPCKS